MFMKMKAVTGPIIATGLQETLLTMNWCGTIKTCKNQSPWKGRNFVFYDQRSDSGREFKSKPLSVDDFDACTKRKGCSVCELTIVEYRRKAEEILEKDKAGEFAFGSKKTYRCSSHCGSGSAAGFADAGPRHEAVAERHTIVALQTEFASQVE